MEQINSSSGGLQLIEVDRDVYAQIGANYDSNAGFIIGTEGVVVVDTQTTPFQSISLLSAIRQRTDRPILQIINTHFHGDHTLGNQLFSSWARILAHSACRRIMKELGEGLVERYRQRFGSALDGVHPYLPNLLINGRTDLVIGDKEIQIHPMAPAHTDSDLVVYLPGQKLLFSGDLLFVGRVPFMGNASVAGWKRALNILMDWDIVKVVPGHGPISSAKALREISEYIRCMESAARRGRDAGISTQEMAGDEELAPYRSLDRFNEWTTSNLEAILQQMT